MLIATKKTPKHRSLHCVQVAAMLCVVSSLPCLVAALVAPESPRHLLLQGERTLALDALQWLRGQLADLGQEFTRLSDGLAACPAAKEGVLGTITR